MWYHMNYVNGEVHGRQLQYDRNGKLYYNHNYVDGVFKN